ncbi:hypothetical protein CBS101457_002698 [Exobasidium rhododendri]|nr:hypothetical protein CBS101457_002698 [Exobasidium rhododendri]
MTNSRPRDAERERVQNLGPIVRLGDITERSQFNNSFLLRLATVSDATMLVRRWHRRIYISKAGLKLQNEEAGDSEKVMNAVGDKSQEEGDLTFGALEEEAEYEGDGEGIEGDDDIARATVKWQNEIRNGSRLNISNNEGIRCIVDAYLMH